LYLLSTCLALKAGFSSESEFGDGPVNFLSSSRDGPMNFLPPAFSGRFPDYRGEEPGVVVASFQA